MNWLLFFLAILSSWLSGQEVTDSVQFTVSRSDDGVSEGRLAEVRNLVALGLEKLEPVFPAARDRSFTLWVHSRDASMPRHLRATHLPQSPGFALLGKNEIHLILEWMQPEPPADLDSVIRHELVHVLLHARAGVAANKVPRWFHEGLAQTLAGGPYYGVTEEDLVVRVAGNHFLPFGDLVRGFPRARTKLAYGQSWSFVAFLRREFGLERLLRIVEEASLPDVTFNAALVRVLRRTRFDLETDWRRYLAWDSGAGARSLYRNCFSWLMILAVPALILAAFRRLRREHLIRSRMEEQERRAARRSIHVAVDPGAPVEQYGPPAPPHLLRRLEDHSP